MTDTKNISRSYAMPRLDMKLKTVASLIGIISAVLLPQIVHMVGKITETGSHLGEMLLPMQLPVLIVGLFAGPVAGLTTGILAPIISYTLTGMPGNAILPFMILELATYGLISGLVREFKTNTFFKVFLAQFAGRGIRAIAILVAFYVVGSDKIAPAVIWTSIKVGFVGILVQLIVIPFLIYIVRKADEDGITG
ncbi:MAG: ECF transporter S component [Lachnospiraceae bacterium]|nr:ECF transporter S component [Lachnospiraceae bacterium]